MSALRRSRLLRAHGAQVRAAIYRERTVLAIFLVLLAACGSPKRVGDVCKSDTECPGSAGWPASCDTSVKDGSCTAVCDADVDCDRSGFCAEEMAGMKRCRRLCTGDADCRAVRPDFLCKGAALDGRRFCGI